jgi:hypothetical protein
MILRAGRQPDRQLAVDCAKDACCNGWVLWAVIRLLLPRWRRAPRHKLTASDIWVDWLQSTATSGGALRTDPLNFRPTLWTQQYVSHRELRPRLAAQEV